jgi:hypothetical protein
LKSDVEENFWVSCCSKNLKVDVELVDGVHKDNRDLLLYMFRHQPTAHSYMCHECSSSYVGKLLPMTSHIDNTQGLWVQGLAIAVLYTLGASTATRKRGFVGHNSNMTVTRSADSGKFPCSCCIVARLSACNAPHGYSLYRRDCVLVSAACRRLYRMRRVALRNSQMPRAVSAYASTTIA